MLIDKLLGSLFQFRDLRSVFFTFSFYHVRMYVTMKTFIYCRKFIAGSLLC